MKNKVNLKGNLTLVTSFEQIEDIRKQANEIVQLAYTACLYPAIEIIEEIRDMKAEILNHLNRVEKQALESTLYDLPQRIFVTRFVALVREISDIATDMIQTADGRQFDEVREHRVHRALLRGNEESDVTIRRIKVYEDSLLQNQSVEEGLFNHGIDCLLIKTSNAYNFNPKSSDIIRQGDIVFVQGTKDNIEELL